jgi:hypothetical protein
MGEEGFNECFPTNSTSTIDESLPNFVQNCLHIKLFKGVAGCPKPIPNPSTPLTLPQGPCRMDDMWTGKQYLVAFQSHS